MTEKVYSTIPKLDLERLSEATEHNAFELSDIADPLNSLNDEVFRSLIGMDGSGINLYNYVFNFSKQLQYFEKIAKKLGEIKNLDVTLDYTPDIPKFVKGDENRIAQIFLNFLLNAFFHTKSGKILIEISTMDNKLYFHIEDTGEGMSKESQKDLFSFFKKYRDKNISQGFSGIGVAVSKYLIDKMNGTVQIDSEIKGGTTVLFEVKPEFVTIKQYKREAKKLMITGYEGERKKVLVIDDVRENRTILVMILKNLGFEIAEANNGKEGLAIAESFQPDLILMDIIMPELNGIEATRQIRTASSLKDVKIVAVSASHFNVTQQESISAGCDDYIKKPISKEKLLDIVGRLLDITWIKE